MEYMILIINIIALIFFIWLSSIFYQLSLALWKDKKAKEKWVLVADSSLFQIGGPLFKWLSPLLVLATIIQIIYIAVSIVVEVTKFAI